MPIVRSTTCFVFALAAACNAAAQDGPATAASAPDFDTEVIPVLTKAGCNSGSCHGAAIGRGGFKLSLLGYDPAFDFDSLVNEFQGRRVNRAYPAKSLVLRKPTLDLDHEGGLRLNPAGDGVQILTSWIAAGTPRGENQALEHIDVSPKAKWLAKPGDKLTIQVNAQFRDGTRTLDRDVTRWSVITATDTATTAVGPGGEVTALARGQGFVMVRFLGEVAAVTITVPIGEKLVEMSRPHANFIDEYVNQTLDDLRIPESPRADDHTFVRRAFLDLIGTLPDSSEVAEFVRDERSDKRARLVDRLLDRPEYVDLWSYKWGDLLRIESRRLQSAGVSAFHRWVRDSVTHDMPLDKMAREMILAAGDSYAVGPANFHRVPGDARGEAEQVSRVFLGVRLQCANCHNHPLDRWTQDDYHGLAATFARIDRGRDVRSLPRGEVIHPKTGLPAAPRIPGGAPLGDAEPRENLAHWLTAPSNTFFARAMVNRVWRDLMGRGLVEPLDDHRATNPATHPDLLDAMSRDFVAHGFSTKHLIRTITASEAYQRSSRSVPGNALDDRFYSRYITRPLPPHVLVDAVSKVTGVPEKLGDLPLGTRAVSLGDSRIASEPLDLLGRCSRDADSSPTGFSAGSLPLTLHTINGEWLNAKITHPGGLLDCKLRQALNSSFIEECYERALSRSPTPDERDHWIAQLTLDGDDRRQEVYQDFLWALLNSAEFCCNH
jgi:Protein of unknown function (DUF1549)/Protein of unknown function (DUF1553)